MADKEDITAPSAEATLRNRKTTVEDADDSDTSPVATTTATSVSSSSTATASKKGGSSSKDDSEDVDKKKKAAATQRRRVVQQPQRMSRTRSILISLFVATLGVLAKAVFEKFLLPSRDITITQTVEPLGNCYRTAFIPGPADIEISDWDEIAFISSDDQSWFEESSFFHRPSQKTAKNGGIYTLPLNQKDASPKEVTLQGYPSDDFHPAGMSLYRFQDPDTQAWVSRLFVINHSHRGELVEIFEYSPSTNTLTFVKSIQNDRFVTPSDIVAVDKERFYLNNLHYLSGKYGSIAEDAIGFAWGSVVYYNGTDSHKVLESLATPYGIAASPDGAQIYVSSFQDKIVQVYNTTEDIATGELVRDIDIWVGNHVDNLSVDKHTGDIYVASHPSYTTYLRHKLGKEPQSPSHVVKLEKLSPENFIYQEKDEPEMFFFEMPKPPPLKWEVKDLFYSNGEDISATSVAAYWNNDLILGSYSSHSLLRCTLSLEQ
ncbi:Serum paraoxonase/arylesterase 2 [Haplosporangium sp. Z 27]|nr:Serum paraoxonase/arylesterase 2 [Haplosporangium sp. Z 27]